MMPRVIPHCRTEGKASSASECRNNGAVYHFTLSLKNAARSSGVNSRQMKPSTTETESGATEKGKKERRSADSGKIAIQDHGQKFWVRNLKVKSL